MYKSLLSAKGLGCTLIAANWCPGMYLCQRAAMGVFALGVHHCPKFSPTYCPPPPPPPPPPHTRTHISLSQRCILYVGEGVGGKQLLNSQRYMPLWGWSNIDTTNRERHLGLRNSPKTHYLNVAYYVTQRLTKKMLELHFQYKNVHLKTLHILKSLSISLSNSHKNSAIQN